MAQDEFNLRDYLDAQKAYFDAKFDGMQKSFDAKFDGLEQKMEARFEGIDQRFEGIDQRFEGIDQRLSTIEGDLRSITETHLKLSADLYNVVGQMDFVMPVLIFIAAGVITQIIMLYRHGR